MRRRAARQIAIVVFPRGSANWARIGVKERKVTRVRDPRESRATRTDKGRARIFLKFILFTTTERTVLQCERKRNRSPRTNRKTISVTARDLFPSYNCRRSVASVREFLRSRRSLSARPSPFSFLRARRLSASSRIHSSRCVRVSFSSRSSVGSTLLRYSRSRNSSSVSRRGRRVTLAKEVGAYFATRVIHSLVQEAKKKKLETLHSPPIKSKFNSQFRSCPFSHGIAVILCCSSP